MRKSSGISDWYGGGGAAGMPVIIMGSPSGWPAGSGVPTTILPAGSSRGFWAWFDGSAGGSGASGFGSSKTLMLFSLPSAAHEAIQKPARLPLTETEVRDVL